MDNLNGKGKFLLSRFIVPDLILSPCDVKVILVLESPHTNEYIHKHPVAQQAGKRLCKQFVSHGFLKDFDSTMALGCEILKHSYKNLGVMNASCVPLDTNFYPTCCSNEERKLATELGKIKTRLQKSTLKEYVPQTTLERDLVNDLSLRFKNVSSEFKSNQQTLVIPCGHLASNLVNAIDVGNSLVITRLEHPSSRKWFSSAPISPVWSLIPKSLLP